MLYWRLGNAGCGDLFQKNDYKILKQCGLILFQKNAVLGTWKCCVGDLFQKPTFYKYDSMWIILVPKECCIGDLEMLCLRLDPIECFLKF